MSAPDPASTPSNVATRPQLVRLAILLFAVSVLIVAVVVVLAITRSPWFLVAGIVAAPNVFQGVRTLRAARRLGDTGTA